MKKKTNEELSPEVEKILSLLPPNWIIDMKLTGGDFAQFSYTNGQQAETHYNQLSATMNLGGAAIKSIVLIKPDGLIRSVG